MPIIGVNTFINPKTLEASYVPEKIELARASYEEKDSQLTHLGDFKESNSSRAQDELRKLKEAALSGANVFEALMECSRYCSLHQMTQALFEAGGQYRRNL